MDENFVIPIDVLDVEEWDVVNNSIVLSMYCEMGSSNINPDTPPTFRLVVERTDGKFFFSTKEEDFNEEEESLFRPSIDTFIEMIKEDFESGKIKIPDMNDIYNPETGERLLFIDIVLPRHYN